MQRVINSQTFQRSEALRAFLLYITEHAISGDVEKLKEQVIGTEVLGRKPNYDPADDNIVRVRAYEIRGRLEKHFAAEGIDEPVVIRMRRGSYVPEFVPRAAPILSTPATPHSAEPEEAEAQHEPLGSLLRRWWLPLSAILLVVVSASVALTTYATRKDIRTGAPLPNAAALDFWSQFFDKPDNELKIVYADTNFALWQDLNSKSLNLGAYLSQQYLGGSKDRLNEVAARLATSPADLTVSAHLAELTTRFGGHIDVRFARNTTADFIHQGNIILIGSHRSNPWIEIFEPNLNFQLGQDPHTGAPVFLNRSPRPHESPEYSIPSLLDTQGDAVKEFTTFGVLALLKDCGGRGLVVIDEGLNMQATEAAGDIISNQDQLDKFLQSIGHQSGTTVTPFEALIQLTSLPNGYDNPKVIAYRTWPRGTCVGD